MEKILLHILTVTYGAVSVINLFAYWPTIKDLYYHKKLSANITSYVLWTSMGAIAFLYSLFILPDFLFRFVSGINFGACALVLFLSVGLKNSN
jgi:hypothetical protein